MKTILVLTDFSENAKAAEKVALRLAIDATANLVLYNVYPGQPESINQNIVWPHSTRASGELQSISNLQSEVYELSDELSKIQNKIHKPEISHLGDAGTLTRRLNEIAQQKDAWMIVMGSKGESHTRNVIFGSNVFKVLEESNCPVLIVPANAKYEHIQKMAYATDLGSSDRSVMEWLNEFCKILNLSLVVVHVSTDTIASREASGKKIATQIKPVTENTMYFDGKNVKESLHQITEEMNVDILALVHRKYGFFDSLFHPSTTHKMIRHTRIPVLILPGKADEGIVNAKNLVSQSKAI
jgi:Universal stress protein UspA and related nucleotide-binding proteins